MKGFGRLIHYENINGVYKIRFFYDGEVRVSRDGSIIEREGIGRYTDTINHKLAIGYWKQDNPFGKQIVYKQKISNTIDIHKEGYFTGDWNKFKIEKILSSFSKNEKDMDFIEGKGLEDNEGPHEKFEFTQENLIGLREFKMENQLTMLKNSIKSQKELE